MIAVCDRAWSVVSASAMPTCSVEFFGGGCTTVRVLVSHFVCLHHTHKWRARGVAGDARRRVEDRGRVGADAVGGCARAHGRPAQVCVCRSWVCVHVWSINHVPVIILRTTNVICFHDWSITAPTSKLRRPQSHTCTMINHDQS